MVWILITSVRCLNCLCFLAPDHWFLSLFQNPGQCKECKNFNSMFAIVSGLGHGAVSRLRLSWEKLPSKYQRLFSDLQELMDPSRNMSKYRQLVASEQTQPPIVSFQVQFFVSPLAGDWWSDCFHAWYIASNNWIWKRAPNVIWRVKIDRCRFHSILSWRKIWPSSIWAMIRMLKDWSTSRSCAWSLKKWEH